MCREDIQSLPQQGWPSSSGGWVEYDQHEAASSLSANRAVAAMQAFWLSTVDFIRVNI